MESNYVEKYLPIGSVVLLKDATKKVMIIGFGSKDYGQNKTFDYSACLYPEGLLTSDQILLFNHDQIKEISFIGFVNEEQKIFINNLKELVSEQNKG